MNQIFKTLGGVCLQGTSDVSASCDSVVLSVLSTNPKKYPWLYRYLNLDYIEDSKRQTIEFANFKNMKNKANKLWLYRILKLPYIDNYVRSTIDFAFFYRPAGDEQIYNETMNGGCSVSGSSRVFDGIVGLGGISCTGTTPIEVTYFVSPVDGYFVVSGTISDNLNNNLSVSGGIFCGGVFDFGFLYEQISFGNLLTGGLVSETIIYNITPTSGLLIGGTGTQVFNDTIEVNGGSLAGGISLETAFSSIVSTGGIFNKGFGSYFTVFNPTLLKILGEDDLLILYQILKLEYVYDSSKIYIKYPQDIIRSSGGSEVAGFAQVPDSVDVSVGGGSLAGGSGQETFNSIVEVNGGLIVGGTTLNTAVYDIPSTGGLLGGGFSNISLLYEQTSFSNLFIGGVSLEAIIYNIEANGGLVSGGSEFVFLIYNFVTVTDLSVGGVSDSGFLYEKTSFGGLFVGGDISDVGFLYEQISSGGLLANGIRSVDWIGNFISTGGSLAGGVATQIFNDITEVGGGLLIGGSSNSGYFFEELVSGGLNTSGSSAFGYLYEQVIAGGLLVGGGVVQVKQIYNIVTIGGSLAGGVATQTFNDIAEAGGGLLIGGSSKQTLNDIVNVDGGISVGGSSFNQAIFLISGGIVCGGLTAVLPLKDFVPFGGVGCSGESNVSVNYFIISVGGSLAKPESTIFSKLIEFSSGGISSSGNALILINFITFGGTNCDGSVDVFPLRDFVPFGGINCGTSANFGILYSNQSSPKIIAGGNSLWQHLNIHEVSGGLKVSGVFDFSTEVSVGGGAFVDSAFKINTILVSQIRGGLLASISSSSFVYYNHPSSAAILLSGSTPVRSEVSIGGGVSVSVFADISSFDFVSFGGITVFGESNNNNEFFIESFGGVISSGFSVLGREFFETSQPTVVVSGDSEVLNYLPFYGGLYLSGESKQTIYSQNIVLGGVKCSGVGFVFVFYNFDLKSHGIKISGEFLFFATIISSGGASLGGQLDLLPLKDFVPFGGVLPSGSFIVDVIYKIDSLGGSRVGGLFNISKPQNETTSGGIKLSGVSFVRSITTQTTFGGGSVEPSSFVEIIEKYTFFTEGGVRSSGSSIISTFTKTNNLRFGKSTFGELVYLHADLESLFLWNRPLSDAELQSFYLNSRKIFDNFNDEYFPLFFEQIFKIETQGGCKVGGSANVYEEVRSQGGVSIGGEFLSNPILAFVSSGGTLISPVSDFALQSKFETSGGSFTGGQSEESLIKEEIVFGGLVCSGVSKFDFDINVTSRISVLVNGSFGLNSSYKEVSENGLLVSGQSSEFATYDLESTGGVFVSLESLLGVTKDFEANISLIISGSSDSKITLNPIVSAKIACSGSAVCFVNYNPIFSSFGAISNGSSKFNVFRIESSTGGCLIEGASDFNKNTRLFSSVSIKSGGLSVVSCDYNLDSLIGCSLGGSFGVSAKYFLVSKQSIFASGSVSLFVQNNIFSQIELICGGLGLDEMDKIYFMAGGLNLSGDTRTFANYKIEFFGGTQINGRSVFGTIILKDTSGGVLISGVSLNVFINSTSGGMFVSGIAILIDQKIYNYVVSTKKPNRLLLGSNFEFDENNYYYEQLEGGCTTSGQSVVTYVSGASGLILGGTSQPVANRLYNYVVSTKKPNRLLLGSNFEFDENNYYYEQLEGGIKVASNSIVTYVSGASGLILGGTSQPVANRLFGFQSQGQIAISGFVSSKRNNYRNEFLGQFKLSSLAEYRLICQRFVCKESGLKCKTKPPCESVVCDHSKEYFANCKYNKQNIRRCKTTAALLPAISNCRQKGHLPVKNRVKLVKEKVTL
jgi:hypothetical protein